MTATGGVYKDQGRIQGAVMKRPYKAFLVHGEELQAPIPSTAGIVD
jgi:hypothetical protein